MLKKYKGIVLGLILGSMLLGHSALAAPYDWIINYRNSDDTADTSLHAPAIKTDEFAVLGHTKNTDINAAWYYFNTNWFNINATGGAYGSTNYKIDLDLGAFNPLNIGNLGDLLDAKVPVTRVVNGHALSSDVTVSKSDIGLGSVANKRTETYSGTTNGSGVYTVTFGTAYSVAPNVQANIINPTDTQSLRITSVSTTGFTVLARNRTDVIGLLPSYANLSGAAVDVLVTEK